MKPIERLLDRQAADVDALQVGRAHAMRFGEAEDFSGIAVYLASKASSYHTAECFVIDGGYSAF